MPVTTTMHAKSDSEVTSLDASTPPRSPRRPLYYVQSPSQHDVEKMSYGSSPAGSPPHNYQLYHYHCSPIHHSRESSTSRFSASLKLTRGGNGGPWKKLHREVDSDGEADGDGDGGGGGGYWGSSHPARFYVICFLFSFIVLFTVFSLILWAASTPYSPRILVKNMVFKNFNIQAGMDNTGVPTDMLSLNSTVRISYRNPATFFGVHVTATPLELYYYQLKVASGHIKKFYQPRKSKRSVAVVVLGNQVPLYGGLSVVLGSSKDTHEHVAVPLNLTFVLRSRAYVLGRLVKPKFYTSITCAVTLRGTHLGKPHNLTRSCIYN